MPRLGSRPKLLLEHHIRSSSAYAIHTFLVLDLMQGIDVVDALQERVQYPL